jgi:autotransporter translocation and assembly factor TamB
MTHPLLRWFTAGLLIMAWLLFTESGLYGCLALIDAFSPLTITVSQATGRLATTSHYHHLDITSQHWHLHLRSLRVQRPPLSLRTLTITAADSRLYSRDDSTISPMVHRLLKQFQSKPPTAAEPIIPVAGDWSTRIGHLAHIRLAAKLTPARLYWHLSTMTTDALHLQGTGHWQWRTPLLVAFDWQLHSRAIGTIHGRSRLSGDLSQQIQLTHQLQGAVTGTLLGTIQQPQTAPVWRLHSRLATQLPVRSTPTKAQPRHHTVAEPVTQASVQNHRDETRRLWQRLQQMLAWLVTLDTPAAHQAALSTISPKDSTGHAPDINAYRLQLDAVVRGTHQHLAVNGRLTASDVTGALRLRSDCDLSWQPQQLAIHQLTLQQRPAELTAADNGVQNKPTATALSNLAAAPDLGQATLSGHLDWRHDQGRVALTGQWQALTWPLLPPHPRWTIPTGHIRVSGQASEFTYQINTAITGEHMPTLGFSLRGTAQADRTTVDALTIELLGGRLLGKGTLIWRPDWQWDVALSAHHLDLSQHWPNWHGDWSLKADSQGSWRQGFRYQLKADAQMLTFKPLLTLPEGWPAWLPGKPTTKTWLMKSSNPVLHIAGTGNHRQVQLTTATLELLGGRLDATGIIHWRDRWRAQGRNIPAWHGQFRMTDVDSGRLITTWPGMRWSALGTVAGRWLAGQPEMTLTIDEITGEQPQRRVRGNAHLRMRGSDWRLEHLVVQDDQGALMVIETTPAPVEEVRCIVAVAALDSLVSTWHGQVAGQLRVQRRPTGLAGEWTVSGRQVALDEQIRVDELTIAATWSPTAPRWFGSAQYSPHSATAWPLGFVGQLQARQVRLADQVIEQIQIDLAGSAAHHRVATVVTTALAEVRSSWRGQWSLDAPYRAQVDAVEVAAGAWGQWSLVSGTDLVLDRTHWQLTSLCLQQQQRLNPSSGCVGLNWRAETGLRWHGALGRLNGALLQPWLPESLWVDGWGVVSGSGHYARGRWLGRGLGVWVRGQIGVTGQQPLIWNRAARSALPVPMTARALPWRAPWVLEQAQVAIVRDEAGLRGDWSLALAEVGMMRGSLALAEPVAPFAAARWQGALAITVAELAALQRTLALPVQITGALSAQFTVAGTPQAPQVGGSLRVDNLAVRGQSWPLAVMAGRVEGWVTEQQRLAWTLQAYTDRLSLLRVQGDLGRSAAGWEVTAVGISDELVLGDQGLVVVPVLVGRWQGKPQALTEQATWSLVGDLHLVRGQYSLTDHHDRWANDWGLFNQWPVGAQADVRIICEPGVQLQAFGLSGAMDGVVRLRRSGSEPWLGEGLLAVREGHYRLAEAVLGVDAGVVPVAGYVLFHPSAVLNPELDLRVEPVVGFVGPVGQVTGTLQAPVVSFHDDFLGAKQEQ